MQQYLNSTEALWGLVTNGITLRLLRDSTFVRRQAYVEFDLQAIIAEKRFEDFAALYRLLQRTRLPLGVSDARECFLEKYYAYSEEQGGRIRDHLRDGVKDCIERLASGFLNHPANDELRRRVSPTSERNERIAADDLYRQLLRLIYRFLFLLVSEDRGLLGAELLYCDYYGIARLRRLVDHRAAYTHHDDIWRSLRVLWRVLSDDKPQSSLEEKPMATVLGLPLLNGELFASIALDSFTLRNSDLLEAFWWLSWYEDKDTKVTRRVNYAALDVEELGSVYESLLEFHPQLTELGVAVTFELLAEGQERRSTGSYYTPPELVAPLVHHALEPVLAERLSKTKTAVEKERTILSMRIGDLACGSGHFLLAAARRLGKELASVRTEADEPPPEAVREAIRDVMTHCIYGVDKNPLAVELCRVALWLESHAAGKPLTFLDHRIRCGDSLVGVFDLSVLERGIPDEAFKPVGGDNKKAAREARKLNASEREAPLFHAPYAEQLRSLAEGMRRLDDLPEDTIEQVRAKAVAYQRIEHSPEFERLRTACDVWTAGFFQSYPSPAVAAVTTEVLRSALTGAFLSDARLNGFVLRTSNSESFFHWPLAFPEVFGAGGFDAIVGNPPFVGGKKISTEYGDKYRNILITEFAPFPNTADLCAAFFRRAFTCLKIQGRMGLIGTNTIGQGDTRGAGLGTIVYQGGVITFAGRFIKWPGMANVEVNMISILKGHSEGPFILDNLEVITISSRLDNEAEAESALLRSSASLCFIGDYPRGIGFVLEPDEARRLIGSNGANARCLLPYLVGEDVNSDVEQAPSRYVICFENWSLERASEFPELLQIVEERVRPERDKAKDEQGRKAWWTFYRWRRDLRVATENLDRVLVRSRVSELHMIAFEPNEMVFSDATVVFAFDDYYHFALLQSNVHEAWVRRNASTMRTDIRYTPTNCLETFAFPQISTAARTNAANIGESYETHRRQILIARQLGLTKIYNLFHDSACLDTDIVRLRELHSTMDREVLACYGWTHIDLGHGFHTNERGHIRFTISPIARREVIRQLLDLNLAIAAEERMFVSEMGVTAETPAVSIAEFDALAYPTSDKDRAICAAALNIVEQSRSMPSMDHMDALLLVTHPQWTRVFLNATDQPALDIALRSSAQALFVASDDSIRWKTSRDYLEKRAALTVARDSTTQTMTIGAAFSTVSKSLRVSIGNVDAVVGYALRALSRIHELRADLTTASSDERGVLRALEKDRKQELAA